jgi:hypothetical protein
MAYTTSVSPPPPPPPPPPTTTGLTSHIKSIHPFNTNARWSVSASELLEYNTGVRLYNTAKQDVLLHSYTTYIYIYERVSGIMSGIYYVKVPCGWNFNRHKMLLYLKSRRFADQGFFSR